MVAMKLARSVRNGWGVNGPSDAASAPNTAAALTYLGTRWVRMQMNGDPSGAIAALQSALVSGGHPDANLKLQLLLNDYLQGDTVNTWDNQKNWLLNNILPLLGANGKPILRCLENPNEIDNYSTGGGAHGPDNNTDVTGTGDLTKDQPLADQNFVAWTQHTADFIKATPQLPADMEHISPTILYFFGANFPTALKVTDLVTYGNMHYYAGINGGPGQPNYPPNPGNFAHSYDFAQFGICPGKPLVQSEGGCTSPSSGGYAPDGRSRARYQAMQLLSHHAKGGVRYMVYNLFDGRSMPNAVTSDSEDNYGLYWSDQKTPKADAIMFHNMSRILSLKLNWADPANDTDTAPYTPTYTGAGLSVTGLQNEGSAGSVLVMPKTDDTTIVAVWNEPPIDSGSGTSLVPTANPIVVNFGGSFSFRVYDPTGGGNQAVFTPSESIAPIASGQGTSVALTLYGIPLLIELLGTGSGAQATPTPTPAVATVPTPTPAPATLALLDQKINVIGAAVKATF